jgi:hypothetical protein
MPITYVPPRSLITPAVVSLGLPPGGSNVGCGGQGGTPGSGPVGSTTNPVTQPAAVIGASSGITSPQPPNRAGFLGLRGGAGVGDGWPSGGWAPPGTSVPGPGSSANAGGTTGKRVRSSGQGDPTLYTMEAATGRMRANGQQSGALWLVLAAIGLYLIFVE